MIRVFDKQSSLFVLIDTDDFDSIRNSDLLQAKMHTGGTIETHTKDLVLAPQDIVLDVVLEEWIDDTAIPVRITKIIATDTLLWMNRSRLVNFARDFDSHERLKPLFFDHWSGPFTVRAEDALFDYFGKYALDLTARDIYAARALRIMMEAANREHAVDPPEIRFIRIEDKAAYERDFLRSRRVSAPKEDRTDSLGL